MAKVKLELDGGSPLKSVSTTPKVDTTIKTTSNTKSSLGLTKLQALESSVAANVGVEPLTIEPIAVRLEKAVSSVKTLDKGLMIKVAPVAELPIPSNSIYLDNDNLKLATDSFKETTITKRVSYKENYTYTFKSVGISSRSGIIVTQVRAWGDNQPTNINRDFCAGFTVNTDTGDVKIKTGTFSGTTRPNTLTIEITYVYEQPKVYKVVNARKEYKTHYKILDRYHMASKSYNLLDVTGKTFIPYVATGSTPEEIEASAYQQLATNTAICKSNKSVGVHVTFYENPYNQGEYVEKREVYYIPAANNSVSGLTNTTSDILRYTRSFYKTSFSVNKDILNNITLNYSTSITAPNTFSNTFRTAGVYEADAYRKLRGNVVDEEVFFNKRKNAMKNSLTSLMTGTSEDYNLLDEFVNADGKIRLYNFAKGFSNMINQEALNVKDDITVKRALQNPNKFSYQLILEKKDYDATQITSVNTATSGDTAAAIAAYADFSPVMFRAMLERIANAQDFPLNKLYEKKAAAEAKHESELAGALFVKERNTHLEYYNLSRPSLNNTNKYNVESETIKGIVTKALTSFYFTDTYTVLSNYLKNITGDLVGTALKSNSVPLGSTKSTYKTVYSNSREEEDEFDTLILGLIKPSNGKKLEVYHGE